MEWLPGLIPTPSLPTRAALTFPGLVKMGTLLSASSGRRKRLCRAGVRSRPGAQRPPNPTRRGAQQALPRLFFI